MYIFSFRRVFADVKFFAYIVGVSEELILGIKLRWIALRTPLPRPIDPVKFYNFGQKVKALYDRDLPWMKDNFSGTLHKVVDHPIEVLERLPHTLRMSMLTEEAKEGKQILFLFYCFSVQSIFENG